MDAYTPMMQQYLQIKDEYKEHILFFRLGDFYEMFFDDAKKASKELELTLTGRDCGGKEKAPMCGVPYHSCEAYIARLIKKGYKVAICEQVEDPKTAKGIVKREIVRIITPGTVIESSMLDDAKNNFIASVYMAQDAAAVAFADISTGEVYVTDMEDDMTQRLLNELGRFVPKEVIANQEGYEDQTISPFVKERLCALLEVAGDQTPYQEACAMIKAQFKDCDFENELYLKECIVNALSQLLNYLKATQFIELSHINQINYYQYGQFMELDLTTRRNLELTETMLKKEKYGSLLYIMDKTKTAMGGRLIKNWIERPLINISAIKKRQGAVLELLTKEVMRDVIIEDLKGVYDLERLLGRIVYKTANGRDLRSLCMTLKIMPKIQKMLLNCESNYLRELATSCEDIPEVYDLIDRAITNEPPFSIREGGIIKNGFDSEVDRLSEIMTNAKGYIAKLEASQKEKTGIKNLKIGYNKVFGYYIEVTRSYFDLVPQEYIRKQTLSNCERYITQELKEFENTVLSAREKITALEYEIFAQVCEKIASQIHRVQKTAFAIAQLDVLCSFAYVASKSNYTLPQVDLGGEIDIKDGRHPVVEQLQKNILFVPNDTYLNMTSDLLAIITGPNMAGKSTYLRQTALIVIMAQIGSFVPAKSARIGICDKVFTRVGASDDLSAGQSTFMVEMSEVAHILKNATNKSLIIYDEIGRGTSTFDGLSIAQAVLEYTANPKTLGAKALFATHYHELTELEDVLERVKNYCVAVKKRGDDITFLRKIIRGAADDSYGIEVAKLAGLPDSVINRSKTILEDIEKEQGVTKPFEVKKEDDYEEQVSLTEIKGEQIIKRLSNLPIDTLTPIEALNLLFELKNSVS